jgi:probable phosphoglycerate mutase
VSVDQVVIEADGGARGNPGPAGYGAVVRDASSGAVLAERAESLGVTTNNVAEYSGLIAGLSAAAELGARVVDVRMDSKLVVEQMSGRWQIKHAGLRALAAEAAILVRRFETVRFGWIPRERNKHADALANRAMDEAAGKPVKAFQPGPLAPPTEPIGEPADRRVAGPDSPARAVAAAAATATTGASSTVTSSAVTSGAVTSSAAALTAPGAGKPSWAPPAGVPTRLILVRHGETALTEQRRYSGRGDVPLSERGTAQARATAARLASLAGAVAAVVSSPLSRATGTAALLAAALGDPPVQTEPDLVETDFGDWEGRTFAEVREGWPEQLTRWLDSAAVAPPGGESFRTVDQRVRRAVARLRDSYPGQTVVVVTHVTPIKLLLRDALAAGEPFLYRLYLDPAGLSIVDSWPDGGVAVRTVNDTGHLAGLD